MLRGLLLLLQEGGGGMETGRGQWGGGDFAGWGRHIKRLTMGRWGGGGEGGPEDSGNGGL